MSLGIWGQRWVESSLSLKNLDPSLLMWDMRRNLDAGAAAAIADAPCNFIYPELSGGPEIWWLVVDDGKVDLCAVDPGYDVDLYVQQLAAQHDLGLDGPLDAEGEIEAGNIALTGDKAIARSMQEWLGLSPFAKEKARGRLSCCRAVGFLLEHDLFRKPLVVL